MQINNGEEIQTFSKKITSLTSKIIKFESSKNDFDTKFAFRSWIYVITKMSLNSFKIKKDVCLNIEYEVHFINKIWKKQQVSNIIIFKIMSLLKIRGVKFSKHETFEYIIQNLYFSKLDNKDHKMLIYIRRKLYIIDDLRVKMFIENNILELKYFIINVINKKIRISNYKIEIKISSRSRIEFVKRKIHVKQIIIMSSHFNVMLIIKVIALLIDRNFLFESFI